MSAAFMIVLGRLVRRQRAGVSPVPSQDVPLPAQQPAMPPAPPPDSEGIAPPPAGAASSAPPDKVAITPAVPAVTRASLLGEVAVALLLGPAGAGRSPGAGVSCTSAAEPAPEVGGPGLMYYLGDILPIAGLCLSALRNLLGSRSPAHHPPSFPFRRFSPLRCRRPRGLGARAAGRSGAAPRGARRGHHARGAPHRSRLGTTPSPSAGEGRKKLPSSAGPLLPMAPSRCTLHSLSLSLSSPTPGGGGLFRPGHPCRVCRDALPDKQRCLQADGCILQGKGWSLPQGHLSTSCPSPPPSSSSPCCA